MWVLELSGIRPWLPHPFWGADPPEVSSFLGFTCVLELETGGTNVGPSSCWDCRWLGLGFKASKHTSPLYQASPGKEFFFCLGWCPSLEGLEMFPPASAVAVAPGSYSTVPLCWLISLYILLWLALIISYCTLFYKWVSHRLNSLPWRSGTNLILLWILQTLWLIIGSSVKVWWMSEWLMEKTCVRENGVASPWPTKATWGPTSLGEWTSLVFSGVCAAHIINCFLGKLDSSLQLFSKVGAA